ncbi:MAG: threonylcarbamoyl-AMP synthase [Propionibacteriaceae bacterium]|jgi:tRNA threonylcarbamoyl adenosine modification protein (Sua5/YciO/YrdC/YwlC family)|nr:threonylcarbamoyl-AMP synthase [Propionibacteriaceae bacterium]
MIVKCYVAGDELSSQVSDVTLTALRAGKLVVFPTDTVYGVAADAYNPQAVQRLLDAKGRSRQQPSPVLTSHSAQAFELVESIPAGAQALAAAFWPGALTLVLRRSCAASQLDLGDKSASVALRVPALPFLQRLLLATGPLAVSSANRTGEPAATDCVSAEAMFGDAVGVYLDGGATPGDVASTIVEFVATPKGRVLRAGALSVAALQTVWPDVELPDA